MDIQIKSMAYSPVSPKLDNSDQWQEAVDESEGEELAAFERYIQEIILKKDVNNVTRGEFVNSNTEPQGWLDDLLNIEYGTDPDTFTAAAKALSRELNSKIHGNSKDGVLFCIQATVSGEGIVEEGEQKVTSLLKLDLIEEERLQLDEDRSLTELDLDQIFPEPKELQKGLIYPIIPSTGFRLPGHVKFYQNGNVSEYFHEFLECSVIESSLKQSRDVFAAIGEIKRDRTGQSATGNDLNLFRDLREDSEGGLVGIDEIVGVARDIVGEEVTEDEIASRLDVENPRSLAIDTKQMPSYVKYEIDQQISVKFPSSAENRVEKRESQDGVEIVITGGDVSTNIVDR